MTEIKSYVHGLYPRSEELVAATRDADRGRTTVATVDAQRRADRDAFVALQRESGLSHLAGGGFSWQDLFRPLVAACSGLEAGPLTRWFDNNTFYRTPVMRGPLALDPAALDLDHAEVGLLPGPYTFARLAAADLTTGELMQTLTSDVLRPAAEEYARHGATILHLEEPSLVVHGMADDGWPRLADALLALRDGLDVQVAVHTYFGDAGPWLDRLCSLPVDLVGVDLTETDVSALARPWNTGLLLGCLDGRASIIEDPGALAAVVLHVLEVARPPTLVVSSGSNLEYLPRAIADEKVRVLGAATAKAREESGC